MSSCQRSNGFAVQSSVMEGGEEDEGAGAKLEKSTARAELPN